MRYLFVLIATSVLGVAAVACDSGDDVPGRDIPRTVPPTLRSSVTTPDTPAKPVVVKGQGPIYEI